MVSSYYITALLWSQLVRWVAVHSCSLLKFTLCLPDISVSSTQITVERYSWKNEWITGFSGDRVSISSRFILSIPLWQKFRICNGSLRLDKVWTAQGKCSWEDFPPCQLLVVSIYASAYLFFAGDDRPQIKMHRLPHRDVCLCPAGCWDHCPRPWGEVSDYHLFSSASYRSLHFLALQFHSNFLSASFTD